MSSLHYVPVFEFDPNTPTRMHNGVTCSYTGVYNSDMYEDFCEGTYQVGDLAFAYQPHDEYDKATRTFGPEKFSDAGIGFPCRIIDWEDVTDSKTDLKLLVYLEVCTDYAIVDRRREAANDEGTESARVVQQGSGSLLGLEESAGESGRPYGASLAM